MPGGRYTETWIRDFVRSERKKLIQRRIALCQKTRTKLFVPFAGYFTEAHPADRLVRQRNYKNSPEAAVEAVEAACDTRGWCPVPGAQWDCASGTEIKRPVAGTVLVKHEWQFEPHCERIDASLDFAPLFALEGIQLYIDWTGNPTTTTTTAITV